MQDFYGEFYIREHFEDYCRCCLKNNRGKVNKHYKFLENSDLAFEFQHTFGIDVSKVSFSWKVFIHRPNYVFQIVETEILPANVCDDCFKLVPDFLAYHKKCQSTHQRLTEIKSKMTLKDELIEPIPVEVIESLLADDILVPIFGNNEINSAAIQNPEPVKQAKKQENDTMDIRMTVSDTSRKGKLARPRRQCPECGKFVRNLKGVDVDFNNHVS